MVLERSYGVTVPHSDSYWENEGTDTLRADNYADIVNDLMLLLGEHTEQATIRLYGEDIDAAALMEQATAEVQQETAMGAYLLDYITYTLSDENGYTSAAVQISYRRTAEQQQSVINATSSEAIPDLLYLAFEQGQSEVAIRVGYFATDRAGVSDMINAVQQELDGAGTPWVITFYPDIKELGIVEVILKE